MDSIKFINKCSTSIIDRSRVKLLIQAAPLDGDYALPNENVQVVVNNKILGIITSDEIGMIKEEFIIDSKEGESITVQLRDVTNKVKSDIELITRNIQRDTITNNGFNPNDIIVFNTRELGTFLKVFVKTINGGAEGGYIVNIEQYKKGAVITRQNNIIMTLDKYNSKLVYFPNLPSLKEYLGYKVILL